MDHHVHLYPNPCLLKKKGDKSKILKSTFFLIMAIIDQLKHKLYIQY
jgi:hypothetical protein